uniref:EGF-like domain-containing protein n=1 Tax=Amphilophus citrinellus TaxID=61819 RepID=A0A3Q0RH44_AMPCI
MCVRVCIDVVPDSLVRSVNTWIPVIDHNVRMEQRARARWSMVSHNTLVCAREGSEVCLKECICTGKIRSCQDCSLIDACATSPCANGARCVNWNNHYNCSCPPGFQGKTCRNDIDECRKPGVCLNGGICMNTHGSFRCQCQPGYSGRTCEVSTLPCAPSQCLNGGTCRQTSDHSYECACLPGRISL